MISPIYKIQNRGQVVNNACQWLWEHRRLAFRLMVLPTLICAVAVALNMAFVDFTLIYLLVALYAILVLPVLPALMFHAVENPYESGYPERMPSIREVMRPWWRYFLSTVITAIVMGVAMVIAMITVIGGLLLSFIVPLAFVIAQRDEDAGIGSIVFAIKMAVDSFGNFCMVSLGCWMIGMSMTLAPLFMVMGLKEFLQTFMSKSVTDFLYSIFSNDIFEALGVFLMLLGGIFSIQIITVVYHFFYGHCVEKASHPALIDRMEHFDDK